MLQKNKHSLLAAVVIVALILTYASVYNVALTQQVVITQFGKIVGEPKTEPGLYLKAPFIQKTHYLSKNIVHKWESRLVRVRTYDDKFLCVNSSVMWEVGDPTKYLQKVVNKANVPIVFENAVQSAVRSAFGSHMFLEIMEEDDDKPDDFLACREQIVSKISEMTTPQLNKNGIRLVKIEVKGKRGGGRQKGYRVK